VQRLSCAALLALGWFSWSLSACTREGPAPSVDEELRPVERVVLISIDTLRADHLGLYGYPLDISPHLDRLAERSVVFRHAVASTPITLPSHATLLTGTHPTRHGVHDNARFHLGESHTTLAEHLREHGFRTAAIVGSLALDSRFGLDQGFESYDDGPDAPRGARDVASADEREAQEVTDRALDFLEGNARERFFLFVHYYDPHLGWRAPARFALRFPESGYDAEIAYTDEQMGRIFEALKELGIADSTLVIVTADHGESLGEFGENTHSFFIYQATLRVPLIVHLPGMRVRRDIDRVVGLVDVAPTVLSLLGIDIPSEVQGRALAQYWEPKTKGDSGGDAARPRFVYAESVTPTKIGCNPLMAVVGDRWKYVHTTEPELYDLDLDPREAHNRAANEPERLAALAQELDSILAARGESGAALYDVDSETRASLEALGYIGKQADDSLRLDPNRDDPKGCIEIFREYGNLMILAKADKYAEARATAKKILAVRPDMADVYRYLGAIAAEERNWGRAVSHLELYLALAGAPVRGPGETRVESQNPNQIAEARAILGLAYVQLDRFEEALASLDVAVRMAPDLPSARYNRGFALVELGRRDEAIDEFRRVLQLDPEHGLARARLEDLGVEGGDGQEPDPRLGGAARAPRRLQTNVRK
jgi:arylsulfatase A-like enzyme